MKRLTWREAIRRFKLLRCVGCSADESTLGDVDVEWWVNELNEGPYCASCAVKLANAVDTAHSENAFYQTTRG